MGAVALAAPPAGPSSQAVFFNNTKTTIMCMARAVANLHGYDAAKINGQGSYHSCPCVARTYDAAADVTHLKYSDGSLLIVEAEEVKVLEP